MSRIILHSDANSFYASVECLYNPALKDVPVAVCGDPEARHGIVLTSNPIAKQHGVRTGSPIWQAHQRCPNLVVVKPDIPLYTHFSQLLRQLYDEYTSFVEPFGLDECWLDMTQPGLEMKDAAHIADQLRRRVREEIGITVSVGVSYNKVFAKLASDMKKPDATTVITQENFKQRVWPLPVSDLLFVGPQTTRKLKDFGITTIGGLANADPRALRKRLGKNGDTLCGFANGWDTSSVAPSDMPTTIKSIGNSTTPPHDIVTLDDAKCIYYLLAEGVSARLREQGMRCRCISISARQVDLQTHSCQRALDAPTNISSDMASTAMQLFTENFLGKLPLRSVGVSCSDLSPDNQPVQMDLLGNELANIRKEKLDQALDGLRKRYGHQVVQRGVVLADKELASINPKEENTHVFRNFHK